MRSSGGEFMTAPKQTATEPSEPTRLIYGLRDPGTRVSPGRVADLIDRVFTTDYRVAFKAPDLTPLVSTAPVSEPPPPKARTRASPRVTPRTRNRATAPVDHVERAAAAQCGDNHHGN